MISANNVTLRVGKKALFEDVNIKFTEGNCYGLIGANGAGKSTFLKILSGQLEPTNGDVVITPGQRLSFLQQDHFKYDEYQVLDTVIMGNKRLYEVMKEKDAIYMKEDFSDEDGIRAADLEAEFAEMNGWEAESDAANLLNGLGVDTEYHYSLMKDLTGALKVKVLLAQALFGNPDILLLDEPTNHLDLDAIAWLEEFLINFENTVIVVSHDRYFLNKVCTHTADIDYGKIQLYAGNYDFWYESSQLMVKQMKEANRKKEEKIMEPDEGSYKWGLTTSQSYFPKDNSAEFNNDDTIVDWLTQYSPEKDVTYVRGFLGRMLFAGEDGVKKVKVLSGGEKVRCMLSKLMISGANVLMLDEPTDHLDMESITALNNGLIKFPGVLIFSSRDHQIVQTTANRIMEIVNGQLIDKITTYDEYLESDEMARKRQVFTVVDDENAEGEDAE